MAILLCLFGIASPIEAKVYMTQQQALDQAFPAPQEVLRRTLYLSAEQAEEAAKAAGGPLQRHVVPYYVGVLNGKVTGFAYFDTHLVRTLPETVLIRVTIGGTIAGIDILSFDEPEEYLPRARWLRQFDGRSLDPDLSLKRGIRGLSGATLSSRGITAAARRILAVHRLFVAAPQSDAAPPAEADTDGEP